MLNVWSALNEALWLKCHQQGCFFLSLNIVKGMEYTPQAVILREIAGVESGK